MSCRKKTWQDFRDAGMLWRINTLLHAEGWSIVVNIADDSDAEPTGEILEVFPARSNHIGFCHEANVEEHAKYLAHMATLTPDSFDDMTSPSPPTSPPTYAPFKSLGEIERYKVDGASLMFNMSWSQEAPRWVGPYHWNGTVWCKTGDNHIHTAPDDYLNTGIEHEDLWEYAPHSHPHDEGESK